ncbi:MAG: non-heme iron oxygenase ferredoxin subunit [Actinobacteria bacterium]|nr:non-heme iron oxygenase ferredoxin subunit [Actinomycetota bacterium]
MAVSEIVGRLSDFSDGKPHKVSVDDLDVCLVFAEGQLHAIDDTCTHAEVSLSEGEVLNCSIECWMHGAVFDLKTGEPLGPPATTPVAVHEVTLSTEEDPEVTITLNESRN